MVKARKLPSGRWHIQTFDHGQRKCYTADSKKEVERLAALGLIEEREKANRGKTLEEALEGYINTCKAQGYSPSTIMEYTARKRNSYPDLLQKRVDKIRAQDVQEALDKRLLEGKSIKTVRNDWFLLKAVLNSYVPDLNLSRIKIASRPKRRKMLMRQSWAGDILKAIRERWGEEDFYLYALLTLFAGLRPSESYALKWEDISPAPIIGISNDTKYKMGTLSIHSAKVRGLDGYSVKSPKTEAGNRLLTVSWSLIEEMKRVSKSQDRVITMKPADISYRWADIREFLGLPEKLRFYDLRHYYATTIANSGASEEELAARMGHSTSAFSHQVYVELFEEKQERVNAALFMASDSALKESKSTSDNSKDSKAVI